jgi:tRNA threonylcarbamoyladenosine biosynthesis protein TsaB
MRILAVDTAARVFGAAVAEDSEVRAEVFARADSHARHIMGAVEAVLALSGHSLADLDGLAVTIGPGSFTGLRIGLSAVQGLAVALDLRVAGVMVLDVLARQAAREGDTLWAALDAKRGQVYAACYRAEHGGMVKIREEQALEPREWLEAISETTPGPVVLTGDGALLVRDVLVEALGARAVFAPGHCHAPRAATVAMLGRELFAAGNAVPPEDLAPVYLRKSDAEIALAKRLESSGKHSKPAERD